jgi:hypothetical protein
MSDDRQAFIDQARSKRNALMAVRLCTFLANRGYGCAIQETDDGVCIITYAKNRGEGDIQPNIKVDGGKLVFPAGTDFDLMMTILGLSS